MIETSIAGTELDFEADMSERRARIRARLEEIRQEARATSACSPTACSSCSSTGCHPDPAAEMGLPFAEAYEVC